jgi:hypothetical protein
MAQSDWDLVRGTTSAILNSGLANPLPAGVGSNFCRFFNSDSPGFGPTLRSNKAEFANIPSTKALSATMCMRRQAGFSSGNWAGFRLKSTANTYTTSGNGYGIAFQTGASGLPVIKLNNTEEFSLDGLPIASFYNSNWIRLRLDVFPMGLSADRLFAYRETTIGSGVWDAIGIAGGLPADGVTILSNSPRYAAWGTGNVFIEGTNFSGNSYYFDTFTLSVTQVP